MFSAKVTLIDGSAMLATAKLVESIKAAVEGFKPDAVKLCCSGNGSLRLHLPELPFRPARGQKQDIHLRNSIS